MQRIKNEDGKSTVMITEPKTDKSNRIIPVPTAIYELIEKYRKPKGMLFVKLMTNLLSHVFCRKNSEKLLLLAVWKM